MILINSYVQFTPSCKDELQIAVKEWNQSPDEAFKKGSVIVFPSFHRHRVTPVTSGIRHSLVTWVEGPHWR